MNESPDTLTRNNGRFNRAAIKRHALKVSREARNGKFERVSTEFLENIEAQIEAKLRSLEAPVINAPLGQVEPDAGESFLTGQGKERLFEAFNRWVAREIHRKSNDVRVGKTL
ncbi:MAG TPA: hypothetical protein VEH04_17075 [Verrucomicrobiae bacterium]|nr:hypothetical protein [Verrucomicrobiae bacterium]